MMGKKSLKFLTLVCTLLCVHSTCLSQEVDTSEIYTFVCSFNKVASQDGVEKTDDSKFPPIKFIWKPEDGNQALMSGNAGTVKVLVHLGDEHVDFIQMEPINVTTTILFKTGEVVHSRNTVLLGHLMPSQYYGKVVVQ